MNETNPIKPKFRSAGDSALIIEFGDKLDLQVNRAVQRFDRFLINQIIDGITDTCPTLRSILVRYDPEVVAVEVLKEQLLGLINGDQWVAEFSDPFRRWHIPVCYGGDGGRDLEEVASLLKLSEQQVVAEHCAQVHKVLTLGFAPGCMYLGMMPGHWNLPRLKAVKPQVPAGSISVAVSQTVMTSTPIPTGWRTIGVTPFNNFYPEATQPVIIVAGDEIEFYQIDSSELATMQKQIIAGVRIVTSTALNGVEP